MNKLLLMLFVSILLVSTVSAANWYVSTASSGTGSGNSWVNKKILSSFNWNNVQPGDTVYIDGGTNGLTYTYTLNPTKAGTASNRITITRGVDAGHDGTPTFQGGGSVIAGIFATSYLTINGLAFVEGNGDGGTSVYFPSGSHDIDLTNCSIKFTTTKGIELWGDNIKVLHCNLFTGSGSFNAETDGIWMTGGKNFEIGWSSIIIQNSDTNSNNHKDIIQGYHWQLNGGTSKMHHNFFYQYKSGETYDAGLYYEGLGGAMEFYDNIVVIGGNEGYAIDWFAPNYQSGNPSIKFSTKLYNNVFHIMGSQQGIKLYGASSVAFKNNVVYAPVMSNPPIDSILALSGGTEYLSKPNLDYDYNQYRVTSAAKNNFVYLHEEVSGTAVYTWDQWRATGQDTHSEIFTSGSTLALTGTVPSTTANDYALTSTSSGVDEGTPLTLFNDDIVGTPRPQGSAYDVGAFEFGSGTAQCNVADTNCDSCISLGEISGYVSQWLTGSVTLSQCSVAVSLWLGGC